MSDVALILSRLTDDGTQVIGKLRVIRGGQVVATYDTLERPWKNNRRRQSCIPPGPGGTAEYFVKHRSSPRFKRHLDVQGEEPHRGDVLIHAGNTFKHTVGCILVGRGFGDINRDGFHDVLNSRHALNALLAQIPRDGCPLIIHGVPTRHPVVEAPLAVADSVIVPVRIAPPAVVQPDDLDNEPEDFDRDDAVLPPAEAVVSVSSPKTPGPVDQTKSALQSKTNWTAIILALFPALLMILGVVFAAIGLNVDVALWSVYTEDGIIEMGEWLLMAKDLVLGILVLVFRSGAVATISGFFRR